jgi:hypothetical protein
MASKDLQKVWEQRLQEAKEAHKKWKQQFKVELGIKYFEGSNSGGLPDGEYININKIYSHLQAQLPKLYSVDPYFYVKVKKSYEVSVANIIEMERRGTVRQAMLNYLKTELELKVKARLAIQDAHFAFGVIKTRRASDLQEHPHAGKPILNDDGKEVLDSETGEPMIYPEQIPVNERYEIERVHPDDFLWDADAGPLKNEWSWLGCHSQMTKQEALDDPRLSNAAVKKVKGKKKRDHEKESRSGISRFVATVAGDEEDILDIWEIYDLKKQEWLMLAENGVDLLIKPRSMPPGIEEHSFSILRFTLRDRSPYPIPPVFNAIDPQREMSLSRSMVMTHRKRFNRKYEVVVSKLEDEHTELEKLETGADGAIIRVIANGAVTPIKDAPLDQTNMMELRALDNDIVEAMGTPDIARGIASADSATEAGLLDARLGIREGDRMSMVVDFVKDVARKLDMLVQFHIDRDEAVKITGPQGEEWVTVQQDDYEQIQGEFEYSVNVGATQPRLPDIERAQLTAFLSQVVIPFPQILTQPAIVKQFAELFHIEDDGFVQGMIALGKQIASGQIQPPGQQGGGASDNPIAQIMGMAGGAGGGNANGGGAQ